MVDILLGLQWGDEGKGKLVDCFSKNYDIISRFQGGPNAGHTLYYSGKSIVLHTIPSGIFFENKINVIGNGVVICPITLSKEIKKLQKEFSLDCTKNLVISNKAHLILPTHSLLDRAQEEYKGKNKIGSTLKGIGPTYSDKFSRVGITIGNIFNNDFRQIFDKATNFHIDIIHKVYACPHINIDASRVDEWFEALEILKKCNITSTEYYLNEEIKNNKKILAEGAQGTMLDVDFGTYPFVSSSNTTSSGVCAGLGIPPTSIHNIMGVFKAYSTRVGEGIFPTELFDDIGLKILQVGNEFGSTTGRQRRCGWLDLVALKYACTINGVTHLHMTKADVLDGFDAISVAVDYKEIQKPSYTFEQEYLPVYKTFDAWNNTSKIKNYIESDNNLKKYVEFIEEYLNIPISIISVGPERDAYIDKM